MPVLPLVASISVSPGWISPRFSASADHRERGPVLHRARGVVALELARTTVVVLPGRRARRTSGVSPTVDSRVGYMTRRRRKDGGRSGGMRRQRRNGAQPGATARNGQFSAAATPAGVDRVDEAAAAPAFVGRAPAARHDDGEPAARELARSGGAAATVAVTMRALFPRRSAPPAHAAAAPRSNPRQPR